MSSALFLWQTVHVRAPDYFMMHFVPIILLRPTPFADLRGGPHRYLAAERWCRIERQGTAASIWQMHTAHLLLRTNFQSYHST